MPSKPHSIRSLGSLFERFPSLGRLRIVPPRRIPFHQQLTATECGAACLAMVLGYHGHEVGVEAVREACHSGRDGVNAAALLQAGRRFGLRGRGIKVELEQLGFLTGGTTILHWEFDHFVVLSRVRSDGVEIVDPAIGPRRVPMDEFGRSFTGVALVFEPSDLFQKQKRKGFLLSTIREVLAESGLLPHLVLISLVLQLFGLAFPMMMGQLVDRVLPRGDLDFLKVLFVGLGAVVIFQALSDLVRGHLLLHLRTMLDARMTLGFLDHLVALPYSYFQLRSSGDLMMRLNSNSTLREHLASGTLSGIIDGLLVGVYLVLLFCGNTAMAAAAVAAALLDVLVYLVGRRRQRELTASGLQTEAKVRGYEVEMLTAMETLKASGAEHRAVSHWSDLFVDALNVSLASARVSIKTDAAWGALRSAGPLAIVGVGAQQVLRGHVSLGAMLSLSAIAGEFLSPLSNLVQTAMSLQIVRSYLDRVIDVLQAEPEQDLAKVRPAGSLSGRVALDRVSFRYTPQSPLAVDSVSVNIEPGQFVAIVGRSGSGKSTLANLMLGLFRPTDGRICYDGQDLSELELQSVRRQIGIVSQNIGLFSGTVRDNIALSDPNLPLSRIEAAATLAGIHQEILAMPLGYGTPLIERGASLSGGQRQRIALARAIVHRPSILLLDEATSALDAVTERHVYNALKNFQSTRIVIAHRLSTVRDADVILMMDRGRIAEAGNHTALMTQGGMYSNLIASQLIQSHDTAVRQPPG